MLPNKTSLFIIKYLLFWLKTKIKYLLFWLKTKISPKILLLPLKKCVLTWIRIRIETKFQDPDP